ncbi:bifunctional nuclease family protein [Arthrobacter sp. LAPM80]|uniref:bifunctional nuclease family protein n=1 Tax=Arthrobacter sp. LAPM80 TaxID=3141788 RepID=UPI00398AD5F9
MIEVQIVGVRIELPSNQPLVLLRERLGERHIPIWIGAAEATAIALAEQGVVPPRPLTHDLLCGVVRALGHNIIRVNLTKVEDGVFFAELLFENGITIGSRASDAIAIAQRAKCPIWAAETLVEEAGVVIGTHDEAGNEQTVGHDDEAEEREVRQFREFLNAVEPEDFDK